MPAHLVEREIAHPASPARVTTSMHERKALMAELASGFIALPGEVRDVRGGDRDPHLEPARADVKPVVFLDVDGFYTPLLDFFDRSVQPTSSAPTIGRWPNAVTVADAIDRATSPAPRHPPQVDRPRPRPHLTQIPVLSASDEHSLNLRQTERGRSQANRGFCR